MNLNSFAHWWHDTSTTEMLWVATGLLAQAMFSMRFVVQWIASEKARASVVPETFWYFSCVGGFLLLAYAVYRADPVFIIGQATGLVIYARNIYFIWSNRRAPRPASIV
jgi:lipid-A-disaccharide synthase-like uncharacterized protein